MPAARTGYCNTDGELPRNVRLGLSLDEAPAAFETFQEKEDGMVKVVLKPSARSVE